MPYAACHAAIMLPPFSPCLHTPDTIAAITPMPPVFFAIFRIADSPRRHAITLLIFAADDIAIMLDHFRAAITPIVHFYATALSFHASALAAAAIFAAAAIAYRLPTPYFAITLPLFH
jgi:hypothetical protein